MGPCFQYTLPLNLPPKLCLKLNWYKIVMQNFKENPKKLFSALENTYIFLIIKNFEILQVGLSSIPGLQPRLFKPGWIHRDRVRVAWFGVATSTRLKSKTLSELLIRSSYYFMNWIWCPNPYFLVCENLFWNLILDFLKITLLLYDLALCTFHEDRLECTIFLIYSCIF